MQTSSPEVSSAPVQEIQAMRKLRRAQHAIESIKEANFCCEHHRKAVESQAKKELKRWSRWLEDNATLSELGQ